MNCFFIPKDWITADEVSIAGSQARQIFNVLRLKPKDRVVVLDNSGWEYEVEVEKVTSQFVQGKVINKTLGTTEPEVKITLYQALLKTDKFELVLQKGVELGVSAFVPFLSERCVVKKPGENKITRWKTIIQEAAEQSERTLLPVLNPVVSFQEACDMVSGSSSILLWEEEQTLRLSNVLRSSPFKNSLALNIFIGPEGGFPSSEVDYAKSKNIVVASLGKRVLRAETASIAAISAILYDRGELG
ncbi:MAG: RsmE family RNA methyltransferase [Chloroflexota bacterium]